MFVELHLTTIRSEIQVGKCLGWNISGVGNLRVVKVRMGSVRVQNVRVKKVRVRNVRVRKVQVRNVRVRKVRVRNVRIRNVRVSNVRVRKVRVRNDRVRKVRVRKVRVGNDLGSILQSHYNPLWNRISIIYHYFCHLEIANRIYFLFPGI